MTEITQKTVHRGKLGYIAPPDVLERMSASASRKGTFALGINITNALFKKMYPDAATARYFVRGYDFVIGNKKIDVRGATLGGDGHWHFAIRKNTIADFFCLMTFDTHRDYNILRAYMIPGMLLNHLTGVSISEHQPDKWSEYEVKIGDDV